MYTFLLPLEKPATATRKQPHKWGGTHRQPWQQPCSGPASEESASCSSDHDFRWPHYDLGLPGGSLLHQHFTFGGRYSSLMLGFHVCAEWHTLQINLQIFDPTGHERECEANFKRPNQRVLWIGFNEHLLVFRLPTALQSTCCLPEPWTKHGTAPKQHGILLYLPAAAPVLPPNPPLLRRPSYLHKRAHIHTLLNMDTHVHRPEHVHLNKGTEECGDVQGNKTPRPTPQRALSPQQLGLIDNKLHCFRTRP